MARAKRPTHRFGLTGEFVPTGPNLEAQWHFLNAASGLVPDAIADLRSIAQEIGDDDSAIEPPALHDWRVRWGFISSGDDWIARAVRSAAKYMRSAPDAPVIWVLGGPAFWTIGENITPPQWQPHRETKAEYLERVDAYVAEVAAQALSAGWAPRPEKRGPALFAHFEWLALFQVGGWTLSEIAERYEEDAVTESGVSHALTEMAELVGLQLRRANRKRTAAPT